MPFIDRRAELARLDAFARDIEAGAPERNVALVGTRRIGKSKILEHFRETLPSGTGVVVAAIAMDGASTTPVAYLTSMVEAVVNGLLRRAGSPPLGPAPSVPAIASAAAPFGRPVSDAVAEALGIAGEARPDGRRLFVAATTFPERIATASGLAVMVHADEFQHVADLATYPPFRIGRGRSNERSVENVLKVLRPLVERRPRVGWVVTGSSVRILTDILGHGPLMGRFDIAEVKTFDPADTRALARAVWDELGVEFDDEAADRVDALTYGHPFYADVVSRSVALRALALGTRANAALVDRAMLESVVDPTGAIHVACQEIWDSITSHYVPAVRGIVAALAELGEATVADMASAIGLGSAPNAWRHVQDMERIGVFERRGDGSYILSDPIFRYWLAVANSLGGVPEIADPAAADRAIRKYEEAYLRERADRGRLVEAYVRDLIRGFAGQKIDGRRFGRPGRHIELPNGDDVRRLAAKDATGAVFGYPADVELDACFGGREGWLVEVRDRSRKPSKADIELLARKSAFLRERHGLGDGYTWLISFSGLGVEARNRAGELGILVSGDNDVRAIADAVGVARPREG